MGGRARRADYTQDWAHAFMAETPPANPLAAVIEQQGGQVAVIGGHGAGAGAVRLVAELSGGDPDAPWMKPIDDPDHLDFASDVMLDLAELAEEDFDGD